MRECLVAATHFMFAEHGLHRIMANHRPENARSARLLNGLGFEREGMARAYLKINGAWTDHVLTSLINPAHA
jgi:ribosomal-protein-alanine N-acetyltransferase